MRWTTREGARRYRDDVGALAGSERADLVIDPRRTRTVDGTEFAHPAGGKLEFVELARVLGIAHVAQRRVRKYPQTLSLRFSDREGRMEPIIW